MCIRDRNAWIYRALTFLVISCPCALVISTPLSFFAGIGAASAKGVLVKGSNYLEWIANCDTVVFDKTGTLTEGVFQVSKIHAKVEEQVFLQMAAIAEIYSNHPIAKSIKDEMKVRDAKVYYEIESRQRDIKVEEIHGKGIKAMLDDSTILEMCIRDRASIWRNTVYPVSSEHLRDMWDMTRADS